MPEDPALLSQTEAPSILLFSLGGVSLMLGLGTIATAFESVWN